MPAEHAILGLLALDGDGAGDGLGYGYDLARHFGDGQPLAAVLRLEPGMLYHHLKKLDRVGWIAADGPAPETRPARQVYRLTPAGRSELARWLGEPVARTREIRLEFLVKLYFARRLDPARAARLLAEQRDRCRRLEGSLEGQLGRGDDGSSAGSTQDRAFLHLVLDLRLAQTRAAIAWLDRASSAAEP